MHYDGNLARVRFRSQNIAWSIKLTYVSFHKVIFHLTQPHCYQIHYTMMEIYLELVFLLTTWHYKEKFMCVSSLHHDGNLAGVSFPLKNMAQ